MKTFVFVLVVCCFAGCGNGNDQRCRNTGSVPARNSFSALAPLNSAVAAADDAADCERLGDAHSADLCPGFSAG